MRELHEIRELLEQLQVEDSAPSQRNKPIIRVAVVGEPTLGDKDAPVTIVEFTDFECPFCKRFNAASFGTLKRDFIDTGKVLWVTRDLPLNFHSHALKAAQAAHCAGDQGKYWEMRQALFEKAPKLEVAQLHEYAGQIGLNRGRFETCLAGSKHLAGIEADIRDANAAGVSGTPTFVVGPSAGDYVEGRRIVGAQPTGVFVEAVRRVLDSDKSGQPDG